jgi:hypothetical protein
MDVEQQLCRRGEGQECEKREKRAPFIGEEVAAPRRGAPAPRRNSPPLHGGNPLFMVVTPSST